MEKVRPYFPWFVFRMVALIYFHIYDLGKAVCFNLRCGTVEVINRRKSDCDIEVGSQALWYAFKFAWVLVEQAAGNSGSPSLV